MKTHTFCWLSMIALCAAPALGQFVNGSDRSDGDLDCPALMALDPGSCVDCNDTCTIQIRLASAETGPWDTTPHAPGDGVYDPVQWAVVYQYISIDIPAGFTVTFVNHPKGAPVVWLATGNVTIAGTVELNGADGSEAEAASYAIPGPGGFSGGNGGLEGSAGFGPGGGEFNSGFGPSGGGGGYGCPGAVEGGSSGVMYGTPLIVPLIGGSGGGAYLFNTAGGGGAGGGAILIASSGSISLPGEISANGGEGFSGGGAGSGGGIRLIANDISGTGLLNALGGTAGNDGGCGRIRLEALGGITLDPTMPMYTEGPPESVFPAASAPSLWVAAVNGIAVPADPLATVLTEEVAFSSDGDVTIDIEARNVSVGSIVTVRIVQAAGGDSEVVLSSPLAGPARGGILTADATFDFTSPGNWEVQLSVQP